jgi:RNA polymerase sigma-70 factor (ECF subfamily)
MDPDDIINLGLMSNEPEPADLAQRHDATARVKRALALIPHEQRRALVLSAFFGLTADEISRQESIPLGTAKTRIRTGLGRVRALLEAENLTTGESSLLPSAMSNTEQEYLQ